MNGLNGKKVAVAASRQAEAIDTMISKQGGNTMQLPIQGAYQLNDSICENDVKTLIENTFDLIILTTGIGAETLEQSAQKLNIHHSFIDKLKSSKLAIRGSKTTKWMKQHQLTPSILSADGTMENLLESLPPAKQDEGKQIYLQTYNEDDAYLKRSLEQLGYDVYLSKPYSYKEPDQQVLSTLKETILLQHVDAVVFTSKTQVRNLFMKEDKEKLAEAFNQGVLAAAIGKVTAAELEKNGVDNVFQPMKPKMGAMVVELNKQFS
ncbi:uroporphyrinogen-III synthase [Oceanobacillus timonensis]|uniref:uroporphyrinogen-III synthase n=1 Tax=Oceanobacillus timonensis TaxID=1926285 RepID=UPI0009BAAE63|nr:uroporphyrinogen-III synthase [Oceanobacillus timonensis]